MNRTIPGAAATRALHPVHDDVQLHQPRLPIEISNRIPATEGAVGRAAEHQHHVLADPVFEVGQGRAGHADASHGCAELAHFDDFARSILTARGNIGTEGPAAIYKVIATPEDLSRSFSQLFLGIRIQCAQCHHHPADRWGQDDYFALAGFFTGIGHKRLPGGTEAIFAQKGNDLANPRTKKVIAARARE